MRQTPAAKVSPGCARIRFDTILQYACRRDTAHQVSQGRPTVPQTTASSLSVRPPLVAATLGLVAFATVAAQESTEVAIPRPAAIAIMSASADLSELRQIDARIDAMARTDGLALISRLADRQVPGRAHEYFQQYYQGVRVYGGGVSRQLQDGLTVSIFGTLHEAMDVHTVPAISPADAMAQMDAWSGAGPAVDDPPELVILPLPADRFVLAYEVLMRDRMTYFVDARSGAVVWREQAFDEQSSVGLGFGIQGQAKKVSGSQSGGVFQAHDRLRPAEIVTLDLRHNLGRLDVLLDPRGPEWAPSDVASDADNTWDDPAVVDVHTHVGFTYDYLAARHDWDGADGHDGRIMAMANIGELGSAFFISPPFGPEKTGVVAFGHLPGDTPIASLDVVAHEVMHAVTFHSVGQRTGSAFRDSYFAIEGPSSFVTENGRRADCNTPWRVTGGGLDDRTFRLRCSEDGNILLVMNHGGAINEAYSDIVGTSVEFMFHQPADGPLRADYLIGEDTEFLIRSLDDPPSVPIGARPGVEVNIERPAAYRDAIFIMLLNDGRFDIFHAYGSADRGRTIVRLPTFDYSGLHWNSTILSHAFYLAVEGGENRTTGRSVDGVGAANRADVERAFVRAMTDLMPAARVSMFMAADVIRQSADDLFGRDSDVYRAIDQALAAVDLQ